MTTSPSRIIRFHHFGPPEEVLHLESDSEPGSPEPDQLLLKILHSPINPADLNYAEGTYGTQPDLPAVPGNEASAQVLAVGESLRPRFSEGDLVILLGRNGLWRDHVFASEDQVCKITPAFDPVQAAMLSVNPPTAALLLDQFADLGPGEWITQNAANSGVGRAIIQIARARGIHTLNFVRRESLIGELTEIGADRVLLDSPEGLNEAHAALDKTPPRIAFNAVGGDSALRLMDLLAPGGIHVTYGAMSRRSLKVPNKFLIFKDIQIRGLWVTRWLKNATRNQTHELIEKLAAMMHDGSLSLPVEKSYSPDQIQEAIAHSKTENRKGKILLDFT
jgi:trans-2-enoyl-CoA reductase